MDVKNTICGLYDPHIGLIQYICGSHVSKIMDEHLNEKCKVHGVN